MLEGIRCAPLTVRPRELAVPHRWDDDRGDDAERNQQSEPAILRSEDADRDRRCQDGRDRGR